VLLSCSPAGDFDTWSIEAGSLPRVDQQETRSAVYQPVLYALVARLLDGNGPGRAPVPATINPAPLQQTTIKQPGGAHEPVSRHL
jgi:hypothetical protein